MTSTTPAQHGTLPDIEVTAAGLTALASSASVLSDQKAALSVQAIAIAAAVRAALPAAAAVDLAWTGRGPSLEPAGYFTADGQRLDPEPGEDAQAVTAQLTARIRPWCGNLSQANQAVWGPLAAVQAVFGTALDGEYLLDVERALATAAPTGTCACPPGARTVSAGITAIGHQPGCALHRPPREYFWQDGDQVGAGTLAAYATAFETAHDESLPTGGLSGVVRAWDAGYTAYTVRAACQDDKPGQDGCWPVRLSVPGEEVTALVWALSQPFAPAGPGEGSAAEGQPGQITLAYWVPCRFKVSVPAEVAARILRAARLDQAAAVADRIAAGEPVTGDPGGTRASDGDDSDLAVLARAIEHNHHLFGHRLAGLYGQTGEPDDTDEPDDFSISITAPGPAGAHAAG